MTKLLSRSLCVSFVLAAGATGALAQSSGSLSGDKPVFQLNGDFRFRYEGYMNAQTLNNAAAFNDRDYFRARLRIWETTTIFPDLSLFGRVSAEPRYWLNAATKAADGTEWKYALVDNMYAKWTTDFDGTPIVVTLGRQDIQFADQWLVTDGTPSTAAGRIISTECASRSMPRASRPSST